MKARAGGAPRTGWIVVALVAALWTLGFPALGRYGVNWDEALGDLFFGERYFSFFTTFDAKYLDFAADPYPAGHLPDLRGSILRSVPWQHYPVAATLGAATTALFSRALGWLDPFDAFHAVNLLLGALLVAVLVPWAAREFGRAAAVVATLLLFTAPRVVSELLANVKDFPSTTAFTLALVAFHRAWERGSARGVVASGALWGVALGVKANAFFLPFVILATVAIARPPAAWRGRWRALAGALAGAAAAGLALFLLSWPWLWADPVGRLWRNLDYIALRGGETRAASRIDAMLALVTTTPLPFLLLVALGLVALAPRLRRREGAAVLVAAWIGVVVGRQYLPGAANFDGVRHFLELLPPLALVGGLGAAELARRAARPFARPAAARAVAAAALALPLALQATTLVACHPFEIAWWNGLAGGLGGAQRRGLAQAGDYWGLSYRLGMEWLNTHAPRNAVVAVPLVEHAVAMAAPLRLRGDLGLAHVWTPVRHDIPPAKIARLGALAATTPVYVMTVRRDDWSNALVEECRARLAPEVRWTLDGGEVLSIYRYRPPG